MRLVNHNMLNVVFGNHQVNALVDNGASQTLTSKESILLISVEVLQNDLLLGVANFILFGNDLGVASLSRQKATFPIS
jgi:flagellar biogenesis protein FliO